MGKYKSENMGNLPPSHYCILKMYKIIITGTGGYCLFLLYVFFYSVTNK